MIGSNSVFPQIFFSAGCRMQEWLFVQMGIWSLETGSSSYSLVMQGSVSLLSFSITCRLTCPLSVLTEKFNLHTLSLLKPRSNGA